MESLACRIHECDSHSHIDTHQQQPDFVNLLNDVRNKSGTRTDDVYDIRNSTGALLPDGDDRLICKIFDANRTTGRETMAVRQRNEQVVRAQTLYGQFRAVGCAEMDRDVERAATQCFGLSSTRHFANGDDRPRKLLTNDVMARGTRPYPVVPTYPTRR